MYTQSGRQVQLAARHAAYWREHGRRGPSETSLVPPSSRSSSPGISDTTVPGPPLPIDLIEKALLPLPESATLFQEALRSPDNLDESDLWRWESGPPYVVESKSTATPSELHYTGRLVEVVHGVRLREQQKTDIVRRNEYLQRNRTAALKDLSLQVTAMLEEWKRLTLFMQDYAASAREMTMAEIHLQWQARTIYHIYHLLFI
jgi:hypothetical protein